MKQNNRSLGFGIFERQEMIHFFTIRRTAVDYLLYLVPQQERRANGALIPGDGVRDSGRLATGERDNTILGLSELCVTDRTQAFAAHQTSRPSDNRVESLPPESHCPQAFRSTLLGARDDGILYIAKGANVVPDLTNANFKLELRLDGVSLK